MTLHVVPIPDPPAGQDFQAYVPGRYFYDVTGITATLTTGTAIPLLALDASGNGRDATYIWTPPHSPSVGLGASGAVAGDSAAITAGNFPGPLGIASTGFPRNIPVPTQSVTIEWWYKATPANGAMQVCDFLGNGNRHLNTFIDAGGQINLARGNVESYTSVPVTPFDGLWHHVMIVLPFAGLFAVYRDGIALGINATVAPGFRIVLTAGNVGVNLGVNAFVPSFGIDEVAIYPTALTAADALAHYNARNNFGTYSAAVLAGGPAAYYHLDELASAGREPSLGISDGTHDVEVIPPGFPAVTTPGPYRYSWTPALNADTQSSDGTLTTVATGPIRVPGGYTIGTRTLDIQPGDQWSNVVLQWDDQYMMSLPEFNPYNYPPGANLIFQQIGAGP